MVSLCVFVYTDGFCGCTPIGVYVFLWRYVYIDETENGTKIAKCVKHRPKEKGWDQLRHEATAAGTTEMNKTDLRHQHASEI
jgi:hypothetical protein